MDEEGGPPADFTVLLDRDTRRLEGGRVLSGGAPLRLLRLGEQGAAVVERWVAGGTVGDDPASRALARHLVSTGMVHPCPPRTTLPLEVTIVVPVRDQPDHLRRLLDSLAAHPEGLHRVIVVDDGSTDPGGLAAACAVAWETDASSSSALLVGDGSERSARGGNGSGGEGRAGAGNGSGGEGSAGGGNGSGGGGSAGCTDEGFAGEKHAASVPLLQVVRNERSLGPGAARNLGASLGSGDVVVFLDADVVVTDKWLHPLLVHFADPAVGAVAPRVTAPEGTTRPRVTEPAGAAGPWVTEPAGHRERDGLLGRYEVARSPLDLGPRPAAVYPGSRVGYVPSAALAVRRRALLDVGGFEHSLHIGEDVDFVWRLDASGWSVRYEPSARVVHTTRATLRAWLGQRFQYGTSASVLSQRHPGAIAAVRVPQWAVASWSAAAIGSQRVAAGLLGASGAAWAASAVSLARELPLTHRRLIEAIRLTTKVHWQAGASLAEAIRRPWWPFAVLAAWHMPSARRAVAAAWLVPPCWRWLRDRPSMPLWTWVGLHLADDLAYGAGVWAGCLARSTFGPLLPQLTATRSGMWTRPGPGRQDVARLSRGRTREPAGHRLVAGDPDKLEAGNPDKLGADDSGELGARSASRTGRHTLAGAFGETLSWRRSRVTGGRSR